MTFAIVNGWMDVAKFCRRQKRFLSQYFCRKLFTRHRVQQLCLFPDAVLFDKSQAFNLRDCAMKLIRIPASRLLENWRGLKMASWQKGKSVLITCIDSSVAAVATQMSHLQWEELDYGASVEPRCHLLTFLITFVLSFSRFQPCDYDTVSWRPHSHLRDVHEYVPLRCKTAERLC